MVCTPCFQEQQRLMEDGDGSQVICTHDYATDDDNNISNTNINVDNKIPWTVKQFEEKTGTGDIIPWRDVDTNKPHLIKNKRYVSTRRGEVMVLSLQNQSGKVFNVWATSLIQKELSKDNNNKGDTDNVPLVSRVSYLFA